MRKPRQEIDWIVRGLEKPGKTQVGLAKALGRAPSAVTALLKGDRLLKAHEIQVIRDYLGPGDAIPVVGIAGAGPDGSILYGEGQGNLGSAPPLENASVETVAVEVRGDSMRDIAPNGWFVYYEERREPPTEDMIGDMCVVGLDDGRVMVKTLYRGRKKHHFDLESAAAPTLRDVKIQWAALVIGILPGRRSRIRER